MTDVLDASSEDFSDDEGQEAVEWHQLPPERDFFASPYDPPVKALVQEIREGELVARPTFQRNQVWDTARKSKFVESILLNIPIPTLFFAEDEQKKVVVDGQQRLLALKDFVENKYALASLELLAPLNGKRHDDLTERQRRIIGNRTLRCVVIAAKSDAEIRFQVFERLNQGGIPLNAQEVRHCVYRGSLNDLLHELSKDAHWLSLSQQKEPHPRMLDCELILRFFALRGVLPTYAPPLKKILNAFMRDNRNAPPETLETLRRAFRSAVAAVAGPFAGCAFRRALDGPNGRRWDPSVNRAVFDVQMLLMEGVAPAALREKAAAVRGRFEELCTGDEAFADAVSRATADRTRMRLRLDKWAIGLRDLGIEVPHAGRVPSTTAEEA
jgi:hypothetical protein